jgi:hypothetical protein
MGDRLLRRNLPHILEFPLAERPAARGQYDSLDRIDPVEIEALPDRVVLAIDRQQSGAASGDFLHY